MNVQLRVHLRQCEASDLRALEWFGLFTAHRALIEEAWLRERLGEVEMWVAEVRGFPVAQAWIDLVRRRNEGVGVIWGVRVLDFLQGNGIGTALVVTAEARLRAHGFCAAELAVENDNPSARRFCEKLGYLRVGEQRDEVAIAAPSGTLETGVCEQVLLRKRLTRRWADASTHDAPTGF